MSAILTIGYEGASIEEFVTTLKLAEIDVLIDVRDVPISRKRGFSKGALSSTVEAVGIKYLHLRDLGDPKPGREAARRGDVQTFESIFNAHLMRNGAQ